MHYHEEVEIARKLAASTPSNSQAQRDLSTSHEKLGIAEQQRFDYGAAIIQYECQQELLRRLIEQNQFKQQSLKTVEEVKRRIVASQRAALATKSLAAIAAEPADAQLILLYVRSFELARKGELAAAAEAAEMLLRQAPAPDAGALYDSACAFALCARAIETPPVGGLFPSHARPRALTETEQLQHQNSIRLALDTLKRALAAGYKNFNHMRNDADLIPLRGLPEYESLFPAPGATAELRK